MTPAEPETVSGRDGGAAAAMHAMTVDVEDYFQVEAFASSIDRADWERLPRRVERNTERLLDILADAEVKATFFMLGWVAQRHPAQVRRIVAEGHELASHGSDHRRADSQAPEAFRLDVRNAKRLLEDTGGVAVRGYRAPTFSIGPQNAWSHAVLAEEGYRYSSSLYPRGRAGRGGRATPCAPFAPVPDLVEIPLTTVRLCGINIPASGGGYFRLFPCGFSEWLLSRAGRTNAMPAVFYLHPWEIDPAQPRQHQAPALSRFRHYLNLNRTEARLHRLLDRFAWTRMDRLFLAPASPFALVPAWTDRS